jgi:hypothetical protein
MSTVIIKDVNGVDVNGVPVGGLGPQVTTLPTTTVQQNRPNSIAMALILFFVSCWVVVEAGKYLINPFPVGTDRYYFMWLVQLIFAWGYISFVSYLPPFYDKYYHYRTVRQWFPQFFTRGLAAVFLVYIMQAGRS